MYAGAHEGRRPEGASNGGSKCSAEYTLCPNTADHKNSKYYALADITSLRFIVYIYIFLPILPIQAINIYVRIQSRKKGKTKQDNIIVRVRVVQSWVKMRPSEQATSIESPEKVGWW